ncbi:chloramphenicol resistance protein [Eubacteriaceae bacterium ES2]|nr:chloramphenicol resistance protein [Eubacteriaceae bacterium ES2]
MTIVESIRDFIGTCPYLDEFHKGLGVDHLKEDGPAYMIESTPCEPVVKKYTDGSSIRQYEFIFASKDMYGSDVMQNIENIGFYEHFANWLEEQTKARSFPVMDEDMNPQSILAIASGYIFNTEEVDEAVYQIQCRLKYFKK